MIFVLVYIYIISWLQINKYIAFSFSTIHWNIDLVKFDFQEAKDVKVIDCKIFSSYQGTGIAVLTSTCRVFIINSVDDPRIRRLAEVPGKQLMETIYIHLLVLLEDWLVVCCFMP